MPAPLLVLGVWVWVTICQVANQLILFKTNVLSFVNHVISTLVYQQDAQMKDNVERKHYIYITAVAK